MSEEKELEQSEIESLTEEQVWSVLEFAQAMTDGLFLPSVFNPYVTGDRMKDVTLNPIEATIDNVDSALKAPKDNEKNLQGYSEYFELTSMIYKRMIGYLGNLLSFDLTYVPVNATSDDYKKASFKKDRDVVHDFLDKFDIRKEFKLVMKQLLRQEAFFGILRDDGDKYTIQELPSGYCKIDGRWDYGLLFAFDMNWFNNAGVDINMYPDVFKKMYGEIYESNDGYLPSRPPETRGKSQFAQWVDCSPTDGFWCFKMTPEIATRVPYFSALFPDLVLQPLIRTLQKDQDVISATKILFGEVPLIQKDVKGSATKDQVAISPELLGKFLGMIKKGLYNAIKVASAPLENVQAISFPQEDRSMYDSYLKTATASSGLNSRLIFSTEKPTAIESQLSIDVDEFLVTYVYPYFEAFLEYYVNRRTKRYKFKFLFEGTEFSTNRKQRFETQMALADKGIVMPQKISASIGMQYHDMIRQMELGIADEFIDKLTPIINSFNLSSEDRGRPQKDVSDLTDSGDQTRSDGGNIAKGGDI